MIETWPENPEGVILDLDRAVQILGDALDIDALKALPKIEILELYKVRAADLPRLQRLDELSLKNLSLRHWGMPSLTQFRPPPGHSDRAGRRRTHPGRRA